MPSFFRVSGTTFWLILIVIGAAAFIRWWNLPEFLFFGFEQGRDALQATAIMEGADLSLVGPKTDLAGIFHGVWYYYLLTIPYGLSQGNPLAASMMLVLMNSSVVVLLWKLLKQMTGKRWVGLLAAGLSVVSFELISYSRWLSNVSPAMPLITLAFLLLWQYRQSQSSKYRQLWWVAAVTTGYLAAQFQIIFSLWWSVALLTLLMTRIVPWPGWRWLILSALTAAVWYLPWILFNWRNDFLTLKAVLNYFEPGQSHGWQFNLLSSLRTYLQMIWKLTYRSLAYVRGAPFFTGVVLGLVILGVIQVWRKLPTLRPAVNFLLIWIFMTLPALLFSNSLHLDQIYVGVGAGIVGLAALASYGLAQSKLGRVGLIIGALVVGLSVVNVAQSLRTNQGMFFITIQEGLNLADQLALIQTVIKHPAPEQYRFVAFTIPYFQEEGWQYLHQWQRRQALTEGKTLAPVDNGAFALYVAMEAQVEPYWENSWLADFGTTELLSEQRFGLLRLQQRRIAPK